MLKVINFFKKYNNMSVQHVRLFTYLAKENQSDII